MSSSTLSLPLHDRQITPASAASGTRDARSPSAIPCAMPVPCISQYFSPHQTPSPANAGYSPKPRAGFSFSLDSEEESAATLWDASGAHGGRVPDAVFAYAGAAKLIYLLDMQAKDLTRGMTNE
ncbi:uncharacterized protein EDB91DRAFT_1250199 [Suillus paluster]|uniref:uncharacterized protein n=1 Tax=Suillus paluster TaxID=48578 RepID=UPI001B883E6D|nr:uncharacterized protein EDB91DRAFT_1250199 [Suillus paluster]KAG1735864.1 hypothetical protein EDB91DRAFT_1250199 [Suillus paluster]